MRVLITGITGFAGSHLAEYILAEHPDVAVYGTYRWRSRMENLEDLVTKGVVDVVEGRYSPTIGPGDEPAATMVNNITGQLNIFEAMRRHDTRIRIQIAGSSEEYGLVHPDEVPMKETNQVRPLSPYAVSKVAQDKLAYQYFKSYGLQTVVTRGFNHAGPRRGHVFSTGTFARQIALIEAGRQ